MNPLYRVQIDICLRKPVEADSIWLRKIINLPFVPRTGDQIRLLSMDEDNTLTLELESVTFDTSTGQFEVDIVDESIVATYAESGLCKDSEALQNYLPFEFQRLNTPQAQVVRA